MHTNSCMMPHEKRLFTIILHRIVGSLGARFPPRHILQHVSSPALGRHAPLLFAHRKELRYETVSWRALGLRILE